MKFFPKFLLQQKIVDYRVSAGAGAGAGPKWNGVTTLSWPAPPLPLSYLLLSLCGQPDGLVAEVLLKDGLPDVDTAHYAHNTLGERMKGVETETNKFYE